VAVDVPDFVSAAVNAVEPHPFDVLSAPAVPMVNVGSTNAIASAACKATLDLKVKAIEDASAVDALARDNSLSRIAEASTPLEAGMETAAMSFKPASAMETVLVARLGACDELPVVTPVAIVTVHCIEADNVVPDVLRASDAVVAPEFVAATVNAVEPQPLVVGADTLLNTNVGRASVTTSLTCRGLFNAKVKTIAVSVAVMGTEITKELPSMAGVGLATDSV
jgi:hypothetical protein